MKNSIPRRHLSSNWVLLTFYALAALGLLFGVGAAKADRVAAPGEQSVDIVEVNGFIEYAAGPQELLDLAEQDRLTLRALRGFGVLPADYDRLILALRQTDVDLLGANETVVLELLGRLRQQDSEHLDELMALWGFLVAKDYLDWQPLESGQNMTWSDGMLLRGGGDLVLQGAEGQSYTLFLDNTDFIPVSFAALRDQQYWVEEGMSLQTYAAFEGWYGLRVDPDDILWTYILPLPDGDYLIAAPMPSQYGMEIWLLRRDAEDRVQWTRRLAANEWLDFRLHALALRPDQRIWVLGHHEGIDHPFIMELDQDGHVHWTRAIDTQLVDTTLTEVDDNWGAWWALAADSPDTVAMVGATVVVDPAGSGEQIIGRMAVLDAHGERLWQQEWPQRGAAEVVVDVEDGWMVAGFGLDTADPSWVLRIDREGSILWERELPATHEWGILLADWASDEHLAIMSHAENGHSAWIRSVDAQGELHAEVEVSLLPESWRWLADPDWAWLSAEFFDEGAGFTDWVESIDAFHANGEGYWLAGSAKAGSAWVTAVGLDGERHWLQHYGQAGQYFISGLLPREQDIVVTGLYREDWNDPLRLMTLITDQQGRFAPTTPVLPAFADTLQAMLDEWWTLVEFLPVQFASGLEIHPWGEDGIELSLPFTALSLGRSALGPGLPELELDPGLLQWRVRQEQEQRWRIEMRRPDPIILRDADEGYALGQLNWTGPDWHVVWASDLGSVLETLIDVQTMELALLPDGDVLTQYTQSLDAEAGPSALEWLDDEAPERLSLERFLVTLETDESSDGKLSGEAVIDLSDLLVAGLNQSWLVRLGHAGLVSDFQGSDRESLALLNAWSQDPMQAMGEDPQHILHTVLRAMGGMNLNVTVNDGAVEPPNEQGYARLGQAAWSLGFNPSPDQEGWLRDISVSFMLGDWLFRDELREEGSQIAHYDVQLGLQRLDPEAWLGLSMDALTMARGFDPEALLTYADQLLGGVDFSLYVRGVDGEALAAVNEMLLLDELSLDVNLQGLNASAPGLSVRYQHAVRPGPEWMYQVPMPVELMPQRVELDLDMQGLPVALFTDARRLQRLQTGEADPAMEALLLAQKNQSSATLGLFEIGTDLGQLRVHGQAGMAERANAQSMPVMQADMHIEILNLDALVEAILDTAGPAVPRRDAMAFITMLKLAGEEVKEDDGSSLHRFHVRADTAGTLMVNQTDFAPMVFGE